MISKELETIILKLLDKTRKNEIKWVPAGNFDFISSTPEMSNDYVVNTSNFTINIYEQLVDEISTGLRVDLYDSRAERVSTSSIEITDSFYPSARELMDLVSKTVKGEDKLIELINKTLDDPGILGGEEPDIPF